MSKESLLIRTHANTIIGLVINEPDIWGLSDRQVEVLQRVSRGESFADIAFHVGFSRGTVVNDFNRAMRMVRRKAKVYTNIIKKHQEMKAEMAQIRLQVKDLPKLSGTVRITDIDTSVRLFNALKYHSISTLNEIDTETLRDLLKLKYFGKKSMNELIALLKEYGFIDPKTKY